MKHFLLYIAVILLVLSGCVGQAREIKDELQLTIEPINEEELQILMNRSGYFTKEESQQRYAAIAFNYEITNGRQFDNLNVTHNFDWDLLMDAVTFEEGIKYFNGSGAGRNYSNGSFKFYHERFIFYAHDFSSDELKDIFSTYTLTLSWNEADGNYVEKKVPIGKYLEDKR